MQLISGFNKRIRFLLCAIGIYSKYAWVIPLKGKWVTSSNAFHNLRSNRNPNKIWVDNAVNFTKDQWNYGWKKIS